jgi:4'-phosphopantetheinyl transferase
MEKVEIHLWCAYPDDLLDEETADACLRLLSEDERARWRAFKFERHRREYLATHALARTALSHHAALPREALRFRLNAHGKPFVEPECGLRFNLSNSPGLVVCLIGKDVAVGVDVEPQTRAKSIAEVGPRMFSPRELAQLERLHDDQRPGRLLPLWTVKEAYSKARGMGLALPLDRVSILLDEAGNMRMEMDPGFDDEPDRWRFSVLEHAGHCIALMVESSTAPELQAWEARIPSTVPERLTPVNGHWFPVP